ncbi:hypothetical protein C9374_005666 [Naegleria lovaniensis]|uniref:RGS domain-containing protein n=1 Tax=Naegleria lovaniensis TaxID=51637 RepID=A0AA88KHK2_NAELO|nr:uncharacterized protein C9374_005666 [Naegleria lovaniensis]KAG2381874.1 hypothetical protein C9374_005666 [Naegleria lovaniensis]
MIVFDQANNNTVSNSTTLANTTTCSSTLFELPYGLSREENPSVQDEICPDTWISFAFMMAFLVFYILLLSISSFGIIFKRNSRHVSARSLSHMFLTMFSSFGIIMTMALRIIIGRKVFPCACYVLGFFLGPMTTLPTTCRCLKLFFMYKLNLAKTTLFRNSSPELLEEYETSLSIVGNGDQIVLTPTREKRKSSILSERVDLRRLSVKINVSSPTNPTTPLEHTPTGSPSPTTHKSSVLCTELSSPSSPEANHTLSVKTLRFYLFMTSYKFIVMVYVMVFIFQVLLWLICGGIEEAIYAANRQGARIFVIPGLLEFKTGCVTSTNVLIIILVEAVFYIAAEVVSLILAVRSDRDTWNIKKETLAYVVIQVVTVALFLIASVIPLYAKLADFFIPYGLFIEIGLCLEIVVCVLLPVIYDIRQDASKNAHQSSHEKNTGGEEKVTNVEQLLKEKKTFDIVLDYARRSYCPEAVLCWKEIQTFKSTVANLSKRKEIATTIIDAFLKVGEPLEINISQIEKVRKRLLSEIEKEEIPIEMFQEIETHCLADLMDLLTRLCHSNEYIRNLIE